MIIDSRSTPPGLWPRFPLPGPRGKPKRLGLPPLYAYMPTADLMPFLRRIPFLSYRGDPRVMGSRAKNFKRFLFGG
jgi:hypothetical protein